jgi:hypothetical protein
MSKMEKLLVTFIGSNILIISIVILIVGAIHASYHCANW